MSTQVRYASFLVRLWRLSEQDGSGVSTRWQSEVEHIQTGKSWKFDTLEELSTFLQQGPEGETLAFIEIPEADPLS